ncbi:hypothetical protein BDF20DRAFT_980148 [Mycotypha africana]|uniref:uncharacterized protein n=1 Tax=Mycotypha africana TaxID=64632 RepID=UPI0023010DF6|nr:uncharacterized protein BDF20DRAFT_980148 [Mycotypha africana]KAI8970364.1 hypothetical protein BDF20DRAFT_980148 [Mycotypha africana]
MGKLKRKKLTNALNRLLKKSEKRKIQQIKAQKYEENLDKAKQNQIKRMNPTVHRPHLQYSSKDRILLIGEGNFSFARSLCENYLKEGAGNLVATCYDSEETLYEKYGDEAKDNIKLIQEYDGTVYFGVDCTNLPKHIKRNKYTKIVFNFPHAGAGIKDQDRNVLANQKLLKAFFDSVEPLLSKAGEVQEVLNVANDKDTAGGDELIPDGEIHVTLKTCKPYNLWAIKELVKAKGILAAKATLPFSPDDFPGYEHRRTLGFKEGVSKGANAEILASMPKTFIFVRKEVMDKQNQDALKGAQKRKLEDFKAQIGKKVKRKMLEESDDDDDE